jgi:hypothetical protein
MLFHTMPSTPCVSCDTRVFAKHSLLDLKGLLPYIKASGSNFMLFKTTKENIKLLQEELELGGFNLEQMFENKRLSYH